MSMADRLGGGLAATLVAASVATGTISCGSVTADSPKDASAGSNSTGGADDAGPEAASPLPGIGGRAVGEGAVGAGGTAINVAGGGKGGLTSAGGTMDASISPPIMGGSSPGDGGPSAGGSGVGAGGWGGVGGDALPDAAADRTAIGDADATEPDRPIPPEPVAAVSLDDISVFAAASGTFTTVPYASKLYDDTNQFDLSTSRFTAAHVGDYEVCASLSSYPDVSTSALELDIYVNGVRRNGFAGGSGISGFAHGCSTVRLAAGDYLEIGAYHNTGTAVTFSQNYVWNWLTISEVDAMLAVKDIASFSAPTSTFTKIPYAAVLYDDKAQYDSTASVFTTIEAGDYRFCASLTSSPDLHDLELELYINGAREKAFAGGVGSSGFAHGCRTARLAAGDKVEIWVFQNSGGTVAFGPNGFWNWMTVTRAHSLVSLDNSSAFSAANQTFTKLPYAAALYDDAHRFDTTESRFSASESGDYHVCASLTSYPNTSSYPFELDVFVNGVRENGLGGGAVVAGFLHGCRTLRLVAGNYVEVWTYQGSGIAQSIGANRFWNWMTVDRIR